MHGTFPSIYALHGVKIRSLPFNQYPPLVREKRPIRTIHAKARA
jgi:hypothetical protein